MTPAKLRGIVALGVLGLWLGGAVLAQVTGDSTILKVVTPMMTMVVGWLFTERATTGGNGVA